MYLLTSQPAICVLAQHTACHRLVLTAINMASTTYPQIRFTTADNERLVKLIGERGRTFAREWTTRSARLSYWKHAIDRYAELFTDYDASLNLTAIFGVN